MNVIELNGLTKKFGGFTVMIMTCILFVSAGTYLFQRIQM